MEAIQLSGVKWKGQQRRNKGSGIEEYLFNSIKNFTFVVHSGGETGRRVRLRGVCRKT